MQMRARVAISGTAIAAAVVACGDCGGGATPASPSVATTTLVTLQGGPSHPLLRDSRRFTPDQTTFWAGVDCYENHIEIRLGVFPNQWTIDLGAPRGQRLTAGTYANAAHYPSNLFGDSPGIHVGGEGRGCDDVGSFTITDARFLPSGAIERFRGSFEQHCERFADPLRGEIELVRPPGEQVSCP
jgi:hypothetical protein